MRRIAHRGNISGKVLESENKVFYILDALKQNYDVEVDVRSKSGELFLGHDSCQEKFPFQMFLRHIDNIWIHCKDLESLAYFQNQNNRWNYFFHNNDLATLTSRGIMWLHEDAGAYPGGVLVDLSERPLRLENLFGVCCDNFDYIKKGSVK